MSHKITKEVRTRLAEFAAKITAPDYVPGKPGAPLSADELKAKGLSTDKQGKPIAAGQLYYAAAPPAVNHQRRLESAFAVGGWPRVQVYLQPFITPEGHARQLQAAAAAQPADVAPLIEPAPTAWLDESSTLPDEPLVHIALDRSTAAATSGQIITGPASSAWLDTYTAPLATAEPREFTKLGQRWEAEADDREAAAEQQLIGQLYEAGHPGPIPCGPCRGECAICFK